MTTLSSSSGTQIASDTNTGIGISGTPSIRSQVIRNRVAIYAIFFVIIILATSIRLFYLEAQNFWYDEVEALTYASNLSIPDVHPPVYYGLLHLLLPLGKSEFIFRFPSVMMGVLTVILVYYIGKQLVDRKTALFASALASISPLLIWHSQDARMYSQAVLFAMLTIHYYLRFLRNSTWGNWALYLVSALIAVYSHLYTGMIPVVLTIHLFLFHRKKLWQWLLAQALCFLGYLPWLIVLLSLPPRQIGTFRPVTVLNPFYTYYTFITGYSLGPTINELRSHSIEVLFPYLYLIIPIALVVFILLVTGMRRLWSENREKATLIGLLTFVPVILGVSIPLFRPSMSFNVRYVLFVLPVFLWVLASSWKALNWRIAALLFTIVFVYNFWSLNNYFFNERYAREEVRTAARYVNDHVNAEDHILVVTVARVFDWYFPRENMILSNYTDEPTDSLLQRAVSGTDTLWLVQAREWQTDPDEEIKHFLDDNYRLLGVENFNGVSVLRYCVSAACRI